MILFFAFFAGVLSVLAPCVLPVLPVLLWGGIAKQNSRSPYIILISSLVFIFLFTLLLKVSTLFIAVPNYIWTWISAVIILIYGFFMLFPQLWDRLKLLFSSSKPTASVKKQERKSGFWADVLLGASLWPIFASCSPTYALIISTILPQNLTMGIFSIFAYILGFWLVLAIVIYFGKEAVKKLNRYANPNGIFKKVIWVLLILTGVLILSWGFKWIEAKLVDSPFWKNLIRIEKNALNNLQ